MNGSNKLAAEFGPETRFEVHPVSAVPFRDVQETRFERLKARLLREKLDDVWEPEFNTWLRRASNEAAALAWLTPYPTLVFPALFEEKAREAAHLVRRQAEVYQRSRELLAV